LGGGGDAKIASPCLREQNMSSLSRLILLATLLLFILPVAACKKKEEPSPQKQVRLSTTKAYEKYFGSAPTTDKGTCFAFVIYFPSAKSPGKVVPFPFFTFDEESIKKVAVERLLGGMEVGSYKGEFVQPFPAGSHLLGISEENGTVTVNLSRELKSLDADAACDGGGLDALALTLAQFKGVKEVHLEIEGKGGIIRFSKGCLIHQPLTIDERAVLNPGPPRVLEVAALKDKGAKKIEDVHVYFDRPVDVKDLGLFDKNGNPFAGEIYHSVFDMAAVLKPKHPSLFTDGMPVKVRWKVTDKLGREAGGEETLKLEIKEH
jgi:germination protein M